MPQFTTSDGAQIAFRDDGAGLPLLCLPGLTRSGLDFEYLMQHLTGVRFIRPDYRGRGGSAWTGAASYTVPQETQDQIELLDHLNVPRAAVLGTSRGGIIAMMMAATAKARLTAVVLNDIGPVIERTGLEHISGYIGRKPAARSHLELAQAMPAGSPGFANVPESRWLEEARKHFDETDNGLQITYDPALRTAFLDALKEETPDLWPLFDCLSDVPLGLVHGANSNLLTDETVLQMQARRSDMIYAKVPDRGHIPFLDETESIACIRSVLERVQ